MMTRSDNVPLHELLALDDGGEEGLPRERRRRVHRAVQQHWQAAVRRRRRRRALLSALALAACLLALAALPPDVLRFPSPAMTVRIDRVDGAVWLRGQGSTNSRLESVDTQVALPFGTAISTGPHGRVALRLPSGHSLRLNRGSLLIVEGRTQFRLEGGSVYVDSEDRVARGDALTVETPWGIVREVGTQFLVRHDADAGFVMVREGRVQVDAGASTMSVEAGEKLTVRENVFETSSIEPFATSWQWVADVAPEIDLDGRSLHAFLRWVCRQGGWTLVYGSGAAERRAGEVLLQGSTRDLTLTDALTSVLLASRFRHRLDDKGRLVVEELP